MLCCDSVEWSAIGWRRGAVTGEGNGEYRGDDRLGRSGSAMQGDRRGGAASMRWRRRICAGETALQSTVAMATFVGGVLPRGATSLSTVATETRNSGAV